MINPGDKVIIYRNGHLVSVGVAGPIRGFSQDKIAIRIFETYDHSWLDVDRATGCAGYHKAVPVPESEWVLTMVEKLHQTDLPRRIKQEEEEQIAQDERDRLAEKAQEWYKTLPEDQQKMIDALVWAWRPIAVA